MYFILRVGRRTRKNSPPDRGVGNTADVLIKACAPSPMTSPLSWIASPTKRRVETPPTRASAARSAAGHPAKKTDGFVTADTNGTRSTRAEFAPRASTSGLRRNASLAPAGRRIRIGMRSERESISTAQRCVPSHRDRQSPSRDHLPRSQPRIRCCLRSDRCSDRAACSVETAVEP